MAENSGVNEAPVVLAFDVGDGKVVTDFGGSSEQASSVLVQPDGRTVVGGSVVARYNRDGSLDLSFGDGGKALVAASGLALQPDGKILAAGANGNNSPQLVRLNPDGTPDTDFDGDGSVVTPVGALTTGRSVALQADGKILVAGTSSTGSNADFGLVRYNADGSLDTTFDADGLVTTDFNGTGDQGHVVSVQPDGKVIVAGTSGPGFGSVDLALARYNSDGALDATFGNAGRLTAPGALSGTQGLSFVLQPDGKILLAGTSPATFGSDFSVLRFDSAGNPDPSFDSDGRVTVDFGSPSDTAHAIALQPDGKIVAAGSMSGGTFGQLAGSFALTRLNSDGSLDTSFDADGKVGTWFGGPFDSAEALAIQPDGRIVAAGSTFVTGESSNFALARYDANGQLDPTFDRVDGGLYSENGPAMFFGASLSDADDASLASATVSIAGNFRAGEDLLSFTNDASTMGNIRGVYSPASGVLTLTSEGAAANLTEWSRALRAVSYLNASDAPSVGPRTFELIVNDGSSSSEPQTLTLAVNATNDAPVLSVSRPGLGKATTAFSASDDTGYGVAIQADGRILISGTSGNDFAVTRFNRDGTVDTTFGARGTAVTDLGSLRDEGREIVLQPDGKILVAGATAGRDGTTQESVFALVRYNPDGTLDDTFDGDGKVTTAIGTRGSEGRALSLQADGKIVVTGAGGVESLVVGFSNTDFGLARYNPDGSLDATFAGEGTLTTPFNVFPDAAEAVAVQADGRIVVAGTTQSGPSASFRDFAVARYTLEGRLDTTFDGDGRVTTNFGESEANARSVVLQPDGKLIVGGYGLGDGFIYDFLLARYNTDGSLDATFSGDGKLSADFSSPFDEGHSVTLQPDGKILVAGSTLIPGGGVGPSRNLFALARYNADGSADTTFGVDGKVTTTIGTTSTGRAVAVQPDGKIVVAGNTTLTDDAEFTLVRYNADGSLDTTFNAITSSPTFEVNGVAVVLDPHAHVFDAELAAQGSYAGASLRLQRSGSASSDDVFSATGLLGALTEGSQLSYAGVRVGSVDTNSGGVLTLTFEANAAQARVDGVLQAIAYAYTGDASVRAVELEWLFSDGNETDEQGSGGYLTALGKTTVSIDAGNESPVVTASSGVTPFFESSTPVVDDASDGASPNHFRIPGDGSAIRDHVGDTWTLVGQDVHVNGAPFQGGWGDMLLWEDGIVYHRSPVSGVWYYWDPQAVPFPWVDTGTGDPETRRPSAIDPALTIGDPDSGSLASATVSITGNFREGEDVLVFKPVGPEMGNIVGTYAADGGVLTLTSAGATASLAEWQSALRAVTYVNSSDTPLTGNRTISFAVSDGSATSAVAVKTISVTAVNDAPVNTVPGRQFLEEDGTAKIAGVSVSDPDAATLQVTLHAGDGRVTLAGTNGLSFMAGDGIGDLMMTFTGTTDALNAALANLEYVAGRAFDERDTIRITTSDLGASGAGGTMHDSDTIVVARGSDSLAPSEVFFSASDGEATALALREIEPRADHGAAHGTNDASASHESAPAAAFAFAASDYPRMLALADAQLQVV